MLEGIVFVGLHTEVLQHNCNHFSDEAARENPTAWASKIFWNFHPRSLGRWSHLTNIFEMGWFNHQLDKVTTPTNRRKVFLVSTVPFSPLENKALQTLEIGSGQKAI